MTDITTRTAIHDTWEAAAHGWAKWEKVFSDGMSDATRTMLEMAGVQPGMHILDLASGSGSQTLMAAERAGPEGRVVATDISSNMLDHVRQNAARAGLRNIETHESAAEDLDGGLGPFDAAICRLGLMLFASPRQALDAVQRVLKPGARLAALVFTTPESNPFMAESLAILLRHAGKSPPPPGQPGIFALGGPDVLERLLRDSGFADVRTKTAHAQLRLPNASDVLEMMQQAFGVYRAAIADLDDEGKARAWDEVRAFLAEFETDDGFRAEREFLIGAGSKPN